MKVTISNMAWFSKSELDPVTMHLLKNYTTIIPTGANYSGEDTKPIVMWRETATDFGVPRFYFRLWNKQKCEVIYDVSEGIPITPNATPIKLRDYDQKPIMKKVHEALTSSGEWGTGLMEAYTAFGKTICSIDLVIKLGGNALILVHSEALLFQWVERIKQHYPNCRIGKIQGPVANYKDKDIVIGMIQSLMQENEKYPEEMYRYFRTLIVDEVHRCGAAAFSRAAPKFNTKYSLGVSGTIRRKDGTMEVIRNVLGRVLFTADQTFRVNPVIYVRETPFKAVKKMLTKKDPKTGLVYEDFFDMNAHDRGMQLNFIGYSKDRNRAIAADIVRALRGGRNPLVMSERLVMFDEIKVHVDAFVKADPKSFPKPISHGYYTGGKDKKTKKEALEAASLCNIVYATIQLAKEGIDIERLDTLFMASPLSDVEQLIGRVCRPKIDFKDGKPVVVPKKNHAMVIDYVDYQLERFESSFHSRKQQYRKLGWKVIGGDRHDQIY